MLPSEISDVKAWAAAIQAENDRLADLAWSEFIQADRAYSKVAGYSPANLAKTHWGKGKAFQDMIGRVSVAPPACLLPTVAGLTFGFLLPARLAESTGAIVSCASRAAVDAALPGLANGDSIRITANINGGGAGWNLTRSGTAGGPITIFCDPGVTITNCGQVTMSGNYLRLRGWDYSGGNGVKMDGVNQEIDQCLIHNNSEFGVLSGSGGAGARWRQIWNSKIYFNGSVLQQDHNIYFSKTGGPGCLIANCLLWEPWAYNIQVYPAASDLIITGCTVDGGQLHANQRGGIVYNSYIPDGNLTANTKTIGVISTNQPNAGTAGFFFYDQVSTGHTVKDCLGFGNAGPDFQSHPNVVYTNCTHGDPLYVNRAARDYRLSIGSPAISKVQVAQYGYLPATDIDGNVRVTADAGCYRF